MPTKAELEASITELKRNNILHLKKISELTEGFQKSTELTQEAIEEFRKSTELTQEAREIIYELLEKNKLDYVLSQEEIYKALKKAKELEQVNYDYKKKYRQRETTNLENTAVVWAEITRHFNEILIERGIPNKSVEYGGKKLIRREANNRAIEEKHCLKKYSDDKLGKTLMFPKLDD